MRAGIFGLTALLFASSAQAQPEIKNYTTPGNLESTVKIGCIPRSEVKTTYNPVDLYLGAKACIDTGNYQAAVSLFDMANIFGRFDMQRVADKTAHQAVIVSRMQIFGELPVEKTTKFQAVAKAEVEDPAKIQNLCQFLRHIGPPTYHPRYMIQHGMGAFTRGHGNEITAEFSAQKAWEDVLNTYVHCPAS